jgi:hypothetical protein
MRATTSNVLHSVRVCTAASRDYHSVCCGVHDCNSKLWIDKPLIASPLCDLNLASQPCFHLSMAPVCAHNSSKVRSMPACHEASMHDTAWTCILHREGHARDQALLSSAITAEAYFRFQASPWGISDGPSGTRDRFFSEYLSFPLFSVISQMLSTGISFTCHSRYLFVAVGSFIKWSISICLSLAFCASKICAVFSSDFFTGWATKTQYVCNCSVYSYLTCKEGCLYFFPAPWRVPVRL